VNARALHTSIIRNIGIGNVSEKTISSIKKILRVPNLTLIIMSQKKVE
jgi:hypothetical protein